jgi:hypothetical protein
LERKKPDFWTTSFNPNLNKMILLGIFICPRLSSEVENVSYPRREVIKMKSVLFAVCLICAPVMSVAAQEGDNVLLKDVLSQGSYCHTKFESIREETLAAGQPVVKDVDDIVDFYGSCEHESLGKEEIQAQNHRAQYRFGRDFED